MQLYLLRHAQSENNARWETNPGEIHRYSDIPLTELGREQARLTAEHLAQANPDSLVNPFNADNRRGFGITHIYSSLMIRAAETAHIIAECLALPVYGHTDLHEWGGVYETDEKDEVKTGLPGPGRAYFAQQFPRLILPNDFNEAGWWNRPYEPHADVPARVRRVLKFIRRQHLATDDRVLLVTHGGFTNMFLGNFLGLTSARMLKNLQANHWLVTNNTALARIDMNSEFAGLIYLNRCSHLPDHLIT